MCDPLVHLITDNNDDWLISLSEDVIIKWYEDHKSGLIYSNLCDCSIEFYASSKVQITIDNVNYSTEQWKLYSFLDNLPRNTFIPVLGS